MSQESGAVEGGVNDATLRFVVAHFSPAEVTLEILPLLTREPNARTELQKDEKEKEKSNSHYIRPFHKKVTDKYSSIMYRGARVLSSTRGVASRLAMAENAQHFSSISSSAGMARKTTFTAQHVSLVANDHQSASLDHRSYHSSAVSNQSAQMIWHSCDDDLYGEDRAMHNTSSANQEIRAGSARKQRRSVLPDDLRFAGMPFKIVRNGTSSGSATRSSCTGQYEGEDDDIMFGRDLLEDIDFITDDSYY